MTDVMMSCGDVEERLSDYLEDTLDGPTRSRVRAHLAACAQCSALVADLESIRSGASQLPELTPSRDLWAGVADRIATPVIALGTQPSGSGRRMSQWAIGALAAGLVVATAGITHVVTRQSVERAFASANPARPAVSVAPQTSDTAPSAAARSTAVPTERATRSQRAVAGVDTSGASAGTPAFRTQRPVAQLVARTPAEAALDREISRLRDILRQRRSQLDPETVNVIEESLRVIDEAIAQSRAALARDPASSFLRDRLDTSLEKKVDLLRTAALLPART